LKRRLASDRSRTLRKPGRGLMGFQLLPHHTHDFTIDWANIFIEPETNGPDADILVTKLHADGMPMIRYRIGDVGLFPNGAPGHPVLSCGKSWGAPQTVSGSQRKWVTDSIFPFFHEQTPCARVYVPPAALIIQST